MHPTMMPICAGDAPSCRASTMRPRARICNRKFTAAAKNALYRRNGCRHVQASPSPSSARSPREPLPAGAAARAGVAAAGAAAAAREACIGALMSGKVTSEAEAGQGVRGERRGP